VPGTGIAASTGKTAFARKSSSGIMKKKFGNVIGSERREVKDKVDHLDDTGRDGVSPKKKGRVKKKTGYALLRDLKFG